MMQRLGVCVLRRLARSQGAPWRNLHCRASPLSSSSALFQRRPEAPPSAAPTVTELEQSASRAVLGCVSSSGPLPLTVLSRRLSDNVLEHVSSYSSGLAGYIINRTDLVLLTLVAGVRVVVPPFAAADADRIPLDKQHVLQLCIGVLSTVAHMGNNAFSLPPLPSVQQLRMAVLSCLASHEHASCRALSSEQDLYFVLRQHPQLFTVQNMQVRLRPLRGTHLPPLTAAPSLDRNEAASNGKTKNAAVAQFVEQNVPCSFYIPVSRLIQTEEFRSLFGDGQQNVRQIADELQASAPAGTVDVRVFGNAERPLVFARHIPPVENVSVRHLRRLIECEQRHGDLATVQWAESLLHDVNAAVAGTAAQTPSSGSGSPHTERLRWLRGLSVPELVARLSPALVDSMCSALGVPHDCPEALVVVLDRLRCFFDVDIGAGKVRPWSVLTAEEQPMSLLRETSPLPLALANMTAVLREGGRTELQLFDNLQPRVKQQLLALYNGPAWLTATDEDVWAADPQTKRTCVELFVTTHSLSFFRDRDHIQTTLHRTQSGGAARHMTERDRAQLLCDCLPEDQPISLHAVRDPRMQAVGFSVRNLPADFFAKHSELLRVYRAFGDPHRIVGRANGPTLPPRHRNAALTSLMPMLKFLALHSVGGVQDSALMSLLDLDGRRALRRYGTFCDLAERFPRLFRVHRDQAQRSDGLITYIGPIVGADGASTTAPHLPRILNGTLEPVDGEWNDDWNESD